MKSCDVTHQIIEAVACDIARCVEVDAVKALHNICVIGNLKIRDHRLAEFFDLHIVAVIRTERDGRIDDLRNEHHVLSDDLIGLSLDGVQLINAAVVRNLPLDLLCLFLLSLLHQGPDLFGDLFLLRADRVRLLLGSAALRVVLDHLVHQRELGILKFLFDILPDGVRIFTQKLYINHGFLL